ncbi:protein disulfide [Pseudovirgaria hyperparasitica]|uniref:Protein disulfide n=1 Tax=Pseudovirgaria hyperparasitica TaxID=470096 RepID=A0A6A6VS70_9PEZI|nr:protein disulfide [Pseudovirgaria hyperparasitica]KAF2752995.1 protein disulfide [Pseudovirgaria hyperparasitica]
MQSNNKGHVVEFHYDVSPLHLYLHQHRIEALAARTNARLIYRPTLLGAIYRLTEAPQGAAGSASDVFNSTKKAVTSRALERTIARHGIPYTEPPQHPMKTTAALRLLYCVSEEDRGRLTQALFTAYWVQGRKIGEQAVLIAAVRDAAVAHAQAVIEAIENGQFETQRERRMLEDATNQAVERGAPGVPGFWIPDVKRLFWGQDRMHFVEATLRALNAGLGGLEAWERIGAPLRSLVPRCLAKQDCVPDGEEVKVEFWFDFSSPWAFLGWTQLEALRRRFGTRLSIDMKPFLLGILFREIGAPDAPMTAYSKQKRNYSMLDHGDWVRWWNAVGAQEKEGDRQISFHWADKFPIRTPTVLRVSLVEPGTTGVLYRACWERNMDMSVDDVVRQVLTEAGFDGNALLAKSNEPKYKAELRARTKEAKDAGLCGVPTYRIFRRKAGQDDDAWKQAGDLVWGQDEMGVVEDLIAGWDGSGVAESSVTQERSRL